MEYRTLGKTNLKVSLICLGSMNWGEQNSEAEAHEQLDYAVSQGVNFIDTAEIYPIPPNPISANRTEKYIGNWLNKQGNRKKIILATKVVSRSFAVWLRYGKIPRPDKKNIKFAIEKSLKRLKTDYIDLYQIHFPDRKTNFFGPREYVHDPKDKPIPIEETLEAMQELVKEGKIRYVGVSNETAWGVNEYLNLSEKKKLPRIQSIQNPYSLIMREFENALAEICIKGDVSLLVYSPLSMGALTGKYLHGIPKGSRFDYYRGRNQERYIPKHAHSATKAYVQLARKNGLDPAQMALAFVNSRPFVTSTILGATSLKQLKADIGSMHVRLDKKILKEIEKIHLEHPNPIT